MQEIKQAENRCSIAAMNANNPAWGMAWMKECRKTYIQQLAADIVALPTRSERLTALAELPQGLRDDVEREVKIQWAQRQDAREG